MIRPDAPYCSNSRRHRHRGAEKTTPFAHRDHTAGCNGPTDLAEKTRERCGQGHYAPSRSCNRCPPFSIARTDRNAFEASGEDIPCFVFCGIKAHRRFVWTNLSFSPPTASISARNSYHRGPILPVFVSYLPPYSLLARLPTTLDTPRTESHPPVLRTEIREPSGETSPENFRTFAISLYKGRFADNENTTHIFLLSFYTEP